MSQRIHEYLHQRKLAKDSDKQSLKSINSDGERDSSGNIFDRLKSEVKQKPERMKEALSENDILGQSAVENFSNSSDRNSEDTKDSLDPDRNLNSSSLSLQENNENNNLVDLCDSNNFDLHNDGHNQTLLQMNKDKPILSPSDLTSWDNVSFRNITSSSNNDQKSSIFSNYPQLKIASIPIGILLLNHILSNLMSRQFLFGLLCGITLTSLFFIIYQFIFGKHNDKMHREGRITNHLYDGLNNVTCCTKHSKDYSGWWPDYSPCFSKYPTLISWNDLPRPNIPETQKIPILPPEITTTTSSYNSSNTTGSLATTQNSSDPLLESVSLTSSNPSATMKDIKDLATSSAINPNQIINQNPSISTLNSSIGPTSSIINSTSPASSDHTNYLNTIESCSYLANGLSPTIKPNGKIFYKGWMNMVNTYNPFTHRLNMTKSVYIVLEETTLKIYRPKRNIPRRAMWNESAQTTQPNMSSFISLYTIDMKMTKVALYPIGIVKKRYWSKKYPIYISAKHIKTSIMNTSVKPMKNPDSLKKSNSFISTGNGGIQNFNEDIPPDSNISKGTQKIIGAANIYLFGRTDREKESWYRRLYAASIGKPLQIIPSLAIKNFIMRNDQMSGYPATCDNLQPTSVINSNRENRSKSEFATSVLGPATYSVKNDSLSIPNSQSGVVSGNLQNLSSGNQNKDKDEPIYVEYIRYMAKCMPADWLLKSSFAIQLNIRNVFCDDQMAWLNALIGRIFWDFFREDHWLEKVKQRIQNKLNKIKVPPFIDPLTVVNVELGNDIPVIRKAAKPFVDTHGVWFELEFVYAGCFTLMLETKINLMKSKEMKKEANDEDDQDFSDEIKHTVKKTNKNRMKKAVFLSDEEDSAETTTDSDTTNDMDTFEEIENNSTNTEVKSTPDAEDESQAEEDKTNNSQQVLENGSQKQTKKAIYRLVDKFAKSTLVQNKVILKGIDYMSKTPLKMRVDVFQLSGTIVLNLPPPPSDRLWFGFRPCPQLKLKAKPQIGVMNISVSRILEWIENKLTHEFERVAVLPNMLDFRVPLLVSDQIDSGPSPYATASANHKNN